MARDRVRSNGLTKAMRWAARLLALMAVGLFIYFVVEFGVKVFPRLSWSSPQGYPLLAILLLALGALLLAWRWELAGGVIALPAAAVIITLVCLGSGLDMFYCAALFALPLLLGGALYLGCSLRTQDGTAEQGS